MDRLLETPYDDLKYLYRDYVCPESTSMEWLIPRLILLKRIAGCRKKSTNEIVLLAKEHKTTISQYLSRPEEQTRISNYIETLRHHCTAMIAIQERDTIYTMNYQKFIETLHKHLKFPL